MIVVPHAGAVELLAVALKTELAVDQPLSLRLFKNDLDPNTGHTLASFTEATFDGYYRRVLDRADWSDPATVDSRAIATHGTAALMWTNSGAEQTVFGYYVVNPATAVVWWAERFTPPRVLATDAKLLVQPKFTLRSDPAT